MAMTWEDLLFAHWPIEKQAVVSSLPSNLELDTFDGQAWIGVVPFRMSGVRPRCVPNLPWFSTFPELNVRTYVTVDGKPGVWFYSLDATQPVAVRAARRFFHLPYVDAQIRIVEEEDWLSYDSRRTDSHAPPAELAVRYRPLGSPYNSRPGSLEAWLTERYCLYAADRAGRLYRSDVHHARWPLQRAEAEIERNTMAEAADIELPQTAPLLHFSRRLEVVAWSLSRCGR